MQEGALDEISFDWQYSWGDANLLYDPETFMPQFDSKGNLAKSYEQRFTGNTRTLASAHSPAGVSRDTIISMPDNPDASMNIANPVPNLPGKIGIGSGVSPLGNFSSSKSGSVEVVGQNEMIIGSSQAALMISALKRKQGTDLLSAPRVTVMDGQSATITVAQEFIYPTEYEPRTPTYYWWRRWGE